ncbi:small multidrug resistance pump/multidrug resistance protein EbrA [Fontibacillus phaseoli]|uniref:Small multidrug resistance pump/multidrug resistance protein EbrA n=1 Tax=Fontibacillus phaseoli TaxID=1416533 RepID=A0A369BQD8_9BACL|nr:multidrug efflux SMR transporter [Fontibacillus phaseoli]RCX23773.1 small multidrug resistance pump/multidrug resistance protein EbrA [Fontibacillus phaseoli]
MVAYLFLIIAILSEGFGSSMLKLSQGFKKIWPTISVIVGYGIAFYSLSVALKSIELGTAYAIWAGVGTALTTMIGVLFYKEAFGLKRAIGILLIISGVVLMKLAGSAH